MADPETDEFALIARCFKPLARHPAARGLADDAAFLCPQRRGLVVTTDTIVEGVHFLPDDPIGTIAQKALRVNLSDLAAKAARPLGVLLALSWPDHRPAAEIAAFADGLGADLERFYTALLGGDMTRTPGPLTITVTALGTAHRAPARMDARAGDDLWVSGVIGDGALGLKARLGQAPAGLSAAHTARLVESYRTPLPRLDLRAALARHARASMDVSDGLIADAGKLAAASGQAVEIEAELVPLSEAAKAWAATAAGPEGDLLRTIFTGGDDYEVLFSAALEARAALAADGRFTWIGRLMSGQGVRVIDAGGHMMDFAAAGHVHRLGRP